MLPVHILSGLLRKEIFMKIGIVGRKKDTYGYEQFLSSLKIPSVTSLSIGTLSACQALIFPGGGDITPKLFGEPNRGSLNMDTELDLLQLQIFDFACSLHIPMLGICKGMQLINVALGGTIIQHLPSAGLHTSASQDLYHGTHISRGSFLYDLYGADCITNSRHHQAVNKLGSGLLPVQWCNSDHCVEAIEHTTLPILGVQWHPERLSSAKTQLNGAPLFFHLLSAADRPL